MKVKLICARLKTCHVFIKGVVDRRFKTGYRVIPEDYMGYELRLTLSNPDGHFRMAETIITQYGNHRVISVDNKNNQIDLIQFRSVERGDHFIFTPEIEILSGGYSIGEGSFTTTPRT
jgi:hypothetical protein